VSRAGTEGDSFAETAALSADGRVVAYDSWASTMVPGDTNGLRDVFVAVR
jgi:hypothetical protein